MTLPRLPDFLIVLCCLVSVAHADQFKLAVAANFSVPAERLAVAFKQETGHQAVISTGATGKFYTQIVNGAPFDILLSADAQTPAKLEEGGLGVKGSRFTYATGKLVLWSAKAGVVDAQGDVLKKNNFKNIAIASPKLAPYGAAAVQTLTQLGLLASLQPKFVTGESIGQTFSFVSTGNAELGFVALSQVFENGKIKSGSGWIVPENLHAPLRQDAVQLNRARDNQAAAALLAYLKGDKARAAILSYGYGI